MSKTLIDVDDDLLAKASAHMGTATKKDTVNRALELVVRAAAFDAFVEFVAEGGLTDLSDADAVKQAWRYRSTSSTRVC